MVIASAFGFERLVEHVLTEFRQLVSSRPVIPRIGCQADVERLKQSQIPDDRALTGAQLNAKLACAPRSRAQQIRNPDEPSFNWPAFTHFRVRDS